MCVTLGVIGILLDLMRPFSYAFGILVQGGSGPFSSHCLTKTLLIGCDMTLGRQSHVPAIFLFLSEWREAKPRTSRHGFVQSFGSLSADAHEPPSPFSTRSPSSTLSFWPHFFLQASRFFRTFLDLSGFGSLRLACGTAFTSVRISMSVCL